MVTPETETRGYAIDGSTLTFNLIGLLVDKGILTDDEVAALFERTLSGLDILVPDDEGAKVARMMLNGMSRVIKRGSHPT